jgi:hypothetical protein
MATVKYGVSAPPQVSWNKHISKYWKRKFWKKVRQAAKRVRNG